MTAMTAGPSSVSVAVHRSPLDGATVVQVDTTDKTGHLRVNLNDASIWNRDTEDLPATVDDIAEEIIANRYVSMATFRFAMAQDGPTLDADGVLSILREAIARGMDHRDEY